MKSSISAAEAHKQYSEGVTAFRRQISDAALRTKFNQEADTFFRACRDDARYCRSEEYFAELAESNAWEYLASGTAYHLIN